MCYRRRISIRIIIISIPIVILAAILIGLSLNRVVRVRLQDEILCTTNSVTATNLSSTLISVNIPANSRITKIRATFLPPNDDVDWAHILVTSIEGGVGQRIFETDFPRDPNLAVGVFETDFIHPLDVGPEGGDVFIATENAIPADLTIAVVYCPGDMDE